MLDYLKPKWLHTLPPAPCNGNAANRGRSAEDRRPADPHRPHREAVHRRQAGAARLRLLVPGHTGATASCSAMSPLAIAKTSATPWKRRGRRKAGRNTTAHARAQILYYVAENLMQRARRDCARASRALSGKNRRRVEVDPSVKRLFTYAAWADKYDGAVHNPPGRSIAIAMNEPVGAIGILARPKRRCWVCSPWCCRRLL